MLTLNEKLFTLGQNLSLEDKREILQKYIDVKLQYKLLDIEEFEPNNINTMLLSLIIEPAKEIEFNNALKEHLNKIIEIQLQDVFIVTEDLFEKFVK